MKIERIKLAELRHDDQNARTHDQTNLKAIAGSLEQFGQRKPIVITQDNKVVAGNGTLTAAKLIGWTEIDCVRVPADWTADQIKAYALADNRTAELAQWDEKVMAAQLLDLQEAGFDIEAIGFELIEPAKEIDETKLDEVPDVITERCSIGDIWKLDAHVLVCADSTDENLISQILENYKPEITITDPPYGIGYEYNSHNDESNEQNAKLTEKVFALATECIIWTPGLHNLARDISRFGKTKVVVWNKKFAQAGNGLGGASIWEPILILNKPRKAKLNVDLLEIMTDRENVNGVSLRQLHSCPKPVNLYSFLIEAFTDEQAVIYEPFCGSGTTLLASEKTNRKCIGIEIDPKYCDVIIQRWENLTGKKAELVNASR